MLWSLLVYCCENSGKDKATWKPGDIISRLVEAKRVLVEMIIRSPRIVTKS